MTRVSVDQLIDSLIGDYTLEAGASPSAIARLVADCPYELPDDYLRFLRRSNGASGGLGTQPGCFELWAAESVIDHNLGYQIADLLPRGFVGIGSSGGGDIFLFDLRSAVRKPVCVAPCIGLEESSVIEITEDFLEFVFLIGRDWIISDDPNEPFNVKPYFERNI